MGEPGELAQLLRKLSVFAEDLSLVPRTQVGCPQLSIAPALGTLMCSPGPFRHLHACAHKHACTHTHIHKKGNKVSGEMTPRLRNYVVAHNISNFSFKSFDFAGHSGAHL